MGKRVNPNNKIVQRTIGFEFRQIVFFNEHPDFKPDLFCRKAIDEQIKQIDSKYLDTEKQ
jgi:hypothetical protein